jgi:hypothetical protein
VVVEDDEEDVTEVVESKSKRKRKGASTVPVTNGKAPTKAKGKARTASTVNGHKNDADLVIIDELDDEEPSVARPPSPTKKGKTRAGSSFLAEEGEIVEETRPASSPELERMREERDLVRPFPAPQYNCGKTIDHCCTVQSQERWTVRKHASANKGEKYGTRGRANGHESAIWCFHQWCATPDRPSSFPLTSTVAQEELIKELTVQIARLSPMLKEGRDSTVHFLTREAADEEKRILEERLEKAKEALKQKDAVIKDKDARIAALNEQCTWEL